jgi:hypothetical protein
LYRSAKDLEHWFVYLEGAGWLMFPAKIQGWADRRAVQDLQRWELHEVPAWLAFGTGLLEAVAGRPLRKAA